MIAIKKASITRLNVDAVVNAANEPLLQGGGVCGAIYAAAGSSLLQEACNALAPCKTGYAVITPAFGLKDNKFIIHAVGPIWKGGKSREAMKIYSAYEKALALAEENGCKSIGFPLISAGFSGVPLDIAWRKALQACLGYCCDHEMEIVFAIPDDEIRNMGERILQEQALCYPAYLEKMYGSHSNKFNSNDTVPTVSKVIGSPEKYSEVFTPHDITMLSLLETLRTLNQNGTKKELDEQILSFQNTILAKLRKTED